MQGLLFRLRRIGFVVVLGICIIIYVGLGFVYIQQGPRQKDLEEQIRKTMLVVNKPLPDMEELQVRYDDVNTTLKPMDAPEALQVIVDMAKKSGIDVTPESRKLRISAPLPPSQKVMDVGTYNVLYFNDISVQGSHETVMNLISDLDTGVTMETMVLRAVNLDWVEVRLTDEEAIRRSEFRAVIQEVTEMMEQNGLELIPNPIDYDGGLAVNDMTAFPDAFTTAQEKGYEGTGTPSNGYVLHGHDWIPADNTTEYQTVDYMSKSITDYYYTCESDGTVRQFDGPDLETATEFIGSEDAAFEATAKLSIALYSKLPEG